jgi:hypothetical protein
MGKFSYISDDGNTYTIRMDASNASAVSASAAASTARPNLPHGYRTRYLLAAHPTSGKERRIQVTDSTVGLWDGSTNTISLPDFAASPVAAATYVVTARVGEKRYSR